MRRAHHRRDRRCALSLLLGVCLIASACSGEGEASDGNGRPATTAAPVAGCPIFPADNVRNRDISQLPVDPQSSRYIASVGPHGSLHPDSVYTPG